MGLTQTALTPTDLIHLPPPADDQYYELSEGQLIVVGRAGAKHERIKSRIVKILTLWAENQEADVFPESMFSLGEHTARIPDVAVLLADKIAALPDDDVAIPFAPDLAVEVVSASESARDAEKKVGQYLASGVQEVWQVFPDSQLVRVRRKNGSRDFETGEMLRSDVLKGFEVSVTNLLSK